MDQDLQIKFNKLEIGHIMVAIARALIGCITPKSPNLTRNIANIGRILAVVWVPILGIKLYL